MIIISAGALALFKEALVSALTSLGGKAANVLMLDPLMARVNRMRTMEAIGEAYRGAIERFSQTVNNVTLLNALAQRPTFWEDKALHETLATAVLYPERRRECADDIAVSFRVVAPELPDHLLREAARRLVEAMCASVLDVAAFRNGLEELRECARTGQRFTSSERRRAGAPPVRLAGTVEQRLLDTAEREALACGHDYVSAAHLLLALADGAGSEGTRQESGAAGILASAGAAPRILRPIITAIVKRRDTSPDAPPPQPPLPVSRSVRSAFGLACEAAEREDLDVAEDEQVLEGLLDLADLGGAEGQSVAMTLRAVPVTTATLRQPLAQFTTIIRTLSYR